MSDTTADVAEAYGAAMDDKPEYDIFLVFKSDTEDEFKVRQIARTFEEMNIRCLYDDKCSKAFPAGQPVFKSIVECIEKSKHTVLLLSKDSIDSSWILLETTLALEKSKRCKTLTLKIVLEGVDVKEVEFLKRDLLASIEHFQLDFNKSDWATKLKDYVSEDVKLPDIMPVGSLAHGLVFSHFVGCYRYVLPELKKQLPDKDIYKTNPGKVSTIYNLLLPSSCKIRDDLEGVDPDNRITIKKAEVVQFKVSHAGKPREFNLNVYSIQKEGEDAYYFFADNPNVLKAIYRMKIEELAKVDVTFQVARFYHTMNEVINHDLNQPCNGAVELLPYNDKHESMETILLEAVKRQLRQSPSNDTLCERVPHRLLPHQDKRQENDVTILCLPEVAEDREIANNIASFLRDKEISVATDYGEERGNMSEMNIQPANWYIFVISKQTLEFDNNLLAIKCMSCLHDSISDNSLCVLPVVREVQPRDIPSFIRWVTLVSAEDPNYQEVLLQTIRGEPVKMQHKIPCGDIATGLAWANYINYLSVIMEPPGIRDRIVQLLKTENVQCGCIEKLFIIVPASCKAEESLCEKANESCSSDAPFIHYVGKTDKLERTMAGQRRTFYLHMYKHTNPKTKQSVCFLSEYSASINCLYEMTKLEFAGLANADMKAQCKDFVSVSEDIMSRKAVKDKLGDISNLVKFVHYEDSKQTLLGAIEEQIVSLRDLTLVYGA